MHYPSASFESGSAPDISVIVPTHDRVDRVARLVRHLVRITDVEDLSYELIVVDDGSSDGTAAVLDTLRTRHPLVVIRHDVPRGPAGARNAGTSVARGQYLAWIDDDDLTAPDRLRRQHEGLKTTDARWSFTGRVDVDDHLDVIGHVACPPTDDLHRRLLASNVVPTAAQGLLVERALACEVGEYDPSLTGAEDWDYCIRLAARATAHVLDEPLVAYRCAGDSISGDTSRMDGAVSRVLGKHAATRSRLGVQPDRAALESSLLDTDLATSHRRAVRRARRVFGAQRTLRNGARVVAILVAPGYVARARRDRKRAAVPSSWRSAARAWLDEIEPLSSPRNP